MPAAPTLAAQSREEAAAAPNGNDSRLFVTSAARPTACHLNRRRAGRSFVATVSARVEPKTAEPSAQAPASLIRNFSEHLASSSEEFALKISFKKNLEFEN
jgi:hypothetical protein